MIVHGPRPTERYYVLRNEIADDRGLSWAARGLLIHLLAKPSHWQVSVAALINQTEGARIESGRDAVLSLLRELEKAGYVQRKRNRSANGTLGELDYIVYEGRLAPQPAHPDTANPTQVSNKKKVSTEPKSKDLALPERAHRDKRDKPMRTRASARKATGTHPIWNDERTKLTSEGVSESRSRGCLAKLVHAVGEEEAMEFLASARGDGLIGTEVIDEIMRRVSAEAR